MFGCALIGTPDGFEFQYSGGIVNPDIPIVDLNNTVINIFEGSEILMIKQTKSKNSVKTYYTLYRFAREITRNRTGSYYGSTIILENSVAQPSLIMAGLKDLADIVRDTCISNDNKFHANVTSVKKPLPQTVIELSEAVTSLSNISLLPNSTRESFFFLPFYNSFASYEECVNMIEQNNFLDEYSTVYVSSNREVLTDVENRRALTVNPTIVTSAAKKENQLAKKNTELKKQLSEQLEEVKNLKNELVELKANYEKLAQNLTQSKNEFTKLELAYKTLTPTSLNSAVTPSAIAATENVTSDPKNPETVKITGANSNANSETVESSHIFNAKEKIKIIIAYGQQLLKFLFEFISEKRAYFSLIIIFSTFIIGAGLLNSKIFNRFLNFIFQGIVTFFNRF